jgi:hypothetical protein
MNGIASEEGAVLLKEELDNVENFTHPCDHTQNTDDETTSEVQTSAPKIRKVKLPIMSSSSDVDDWCILDCVFGVPLFDSKLNHTICNAIVQDGLWLKER